MRPRPIGGFLPLAIDQLPAAPLTPWRLWTAGAESSFEFHNARSALAWLLAATAVGRLWLPAYICPELADAVRGAGIDLSFYAVGEDLAPDASALDAALRCGDAVLGVAYFGFPPPAEFIRLAAARPDVLWIEDRAQALDPGSAPWGDWVLYSPRKLVGVPDGGLLVSHRRRLPGPSLLPPEDLAFMSPTLLRLEDPDEGDHSRWYACYRAAEQASTVSRQSMSHLSRGLLQRVDAAAIAAVRRRNFSVLAKSFSALALPLVAQRSSPAPFGFPLLVGDATAIAGRLAEIGIFCARHWPVLPSDPGTFPAEHRLAQSLLTLPCDQRYGELEMDRLVAAVTSVLR